MNRTELTVCEPEVLTAAEYARRQTVLHALQWEQREREIALQWEQREREIALLEQRTQQAQMLTHMAWFGCTPR